MNHTRILLTIAIIVFVLVAVLLWQRLGTNPAPGGETGTSTEAVGTSTDMVGTSTAGQGGQISNVRILRSPDSMQVQSRMCQNAKEHEQTLEVIIRDVRILPDCFMANDEQKVRFENESAKELVITMDHLPPDAAHLASTTIAARSGATLDLELGRFLARGVHRFKLSDGRVVELVMLQ